MTDKWFNYPQDEPFVVANENGTTFAAVEIVGRYPDLGKPWVNISLREPVTLEHGGSNYAWASIPAGKVLDDLITALQYAKGVLEGTIKENEHDESA